MSASDPFEQQGETFAEQLIEFSVRRTERTRKFWREQKWLDQERAVDVGSAEIFVAPWIAADGPLFPQGSGEVVQALSDLLSQETIPFAVSNDLYVEVALNSRKWRLPTFFLSSVVVPIFVNVVSDNLGSLFPNQKPDDQVELHLVVEGKDHRCIEFTYKGPVEKMPAMLAQGVDACAADLKKANRHGSVCLSGCK